MNKQSRPDRSNAGVGLIESGLPLYQFVLTCNLSDPRFTPVGLRSSSTRNLSDPRFTPVGLRSGMGSSECLVTCNPEYLIVAAT